MGWADAAIQQRRSAAKPRVLLVSARLTLACFCCVEKTASFDTLQSFSCLSGYVVTTELLSSDGITGH